MIAAALSGALDQVNYVNHPVFGIAMPTSCPGVPTQVLDPSSTWPDPAACEAAARSLVHAFEANFAPYQGFANITWMMDDALRILKCHFAKL